MMWDCMIKQYVLQHCQARGLRSLTIAAYEKIMRQFEAYVMVRLGGKSPDEVTMMDVMNYLNHLRVERNNGSSAVIRQMVVIRSFYKAMVAYEHIKPLVNPTTYLPSFKSAPKKLPVVLSEAEVEKLLDMPDTHTILGLRDRALLALLYGTGVRASECASLREEDVDFTEKVVKVTGKGGHERTVPMNDRVCRAMASYRLARGKRSGGDAFFVSCRKKPMSRNAIYERVRYHSLKCEIPKRVSPHRLRHTFATHLVKAGVGLVTIRDLLGHRQITSTQIYLHVTAEDLRHAADRHPIDRFAETIGGLLPEIRRPVMRPPRRAAG